MTPIVILFADYNKLSHYIITVKNSNTTIQKWDPKYNCDPMDNWDEYQMKLLQNMKHFKSSTLTILEVLSKDPLFNGFGLNHSTDALHLAQIHPFEPAQNIF